MDDTTAGPELSNSMGDSQLSGFSDGLSGGGASSNEPSTLGSASIDKPLSELLADPSETPSTDATVPLDSSSSQPPPVSIPSIPSASGGETEFYEPKDAVGATLISSPEDEVKIQEPPKPTVKTDSEEPKRPGFVALFVRSFSTFFKHLHQYLILTFFLTIPVVLIFSGFYFFARADEVQAKPSLPPVSAENTVDVLSSEVKDVFPEGGGSDFGVSRSPHSLPASIFYEGRDIFSSLFTQDGHSKGLLAGIILFVVIMISFYYFFARMALARLTFFIDKKVIFSYREILKWSLDTLGSYIAFLIRVFFYVWAWVPILLGTLYYMVHRFDIEILTTIRSLYALDIVFPILIVISLVLMTIRVVRSIFGLYSLADSDKIIRSGAVLEHAIELTRGRWLSVSLYLFLFGLFLSFSFWGLYSLAKILPSLSVVSLILSILLCYIGVVFMTLFYRSLKLFPLKSKDTKESSE